MVLLLSRMTHDLARGLLTWTLDFPNGHEGKVVLPAHQPLTRERMLMGIASPGSTQRAATMVVGEYLFQRRPE